MFLFSFHQSCFNHLKVDTSSLELFFIQKSYTKRLTNEPISPYILYGPHGYRTFPHARCQEVFNSETTLEALKKSVIDVPTVEVSLDEIEGDWFLIEYVNSHDGKPTGAHTPYLCPEARITIDPETTDKRMNVSQMSYEWPALFLDTVEWVQHHNKTGVFFHEENIFSLWTMKVMELDSRNHMIIFLCIDYTIWPGWNHRGVYVLSRHTKLQILTFMDVVIIVLSRDLYRAPIHPYMSRKHRRNLKGLD